MEVPPPPGDAMKNYSALVFHMRGLSSQVCRLSVHFHDLSKCRALVKLLSLFLGLAHSQLLLSFLTYDEEYDIKIHCVAGDEEVLALYFPRF
jgi:predicted protein tyrosine phosphatase